MSNRPLSVPLVALALTAACTGEEVPATQVIVSINSDLEVGRELTSIEVFALDADGENVVAMHPFELTDGEPKRGKVVLPFSFGIVKARSNRFRLDVIGYGPAATDGKSRAVVEQKVSGTFRDRETLLLKVFLSAACFERVCTGAKTCHPDPEGDAAGSKCGAVWEPDLDAVLPGAEGSAWNAAGKGEAPGEAGAGAGAQPGGAGSDGGRAGSIVTAGRAGSTTAGGMSGATAEAGTGGGPGEAGTAAEAGNGAGGASGSTGAGGAAGAAGSTGAAACEPIGEQIRPIEETEVHVATTMPSDYDSQPPSSGPHCEASGVYTTYPPNSPLLPCNFVRNLEKGAIVLLYNCPTPCPEIVASLEQVIADAIDDPDCTPVDDLQRVLLTPYAGMDATFAATAWGVTWTSTCPTVTANDRAALLAFIEDHWGTGGFSGLGNDCSYGTVYPSE